MNKLRKKTFERLRFRIYELQDLTLPSCDSRGRLEWCVDSVEQSVNILLEIVEILEEDAITDT